MLLRDLRTIFLYEFKLNQSAAETVQKNNQAFGNDSVNNTHVDVDLRNFVTEILGPKTSSADEPRSGQPTVIQDEDLWTLVETDPSQTMF